MKPRRCMYPGCEREAFGTVLRENLNPRPLADVYLCIKHMTIELSRATLASRP